MCAQQGFETVAFFTAHEAKEGLVVLAEMMVDVEKDLATDTTDTGRQVGRDGEAVTNTVYLDEKLTFSGPIEQLASQRADHRRTRAEAGV